MSPGGKRFEYFLGARTVLVATLTLGFAAAGVCFGAQLCFHYDLGEAGDDFAK